MKTGGEMNKYLEKINKTKRRIAYLESQHASMQRKPSIIEVNELEMLRRTLINQEGELYYRTEGRKIDE